MATTYKAFFKFATKWWIPIDAIEDRTRGGIPDYIRIDSPGDVDLYAKLEEALKRQRLGLRVPYSTTSSVIGKQAMDSLNHYHQYQNYNPSFQMWFGIQRFLDGRFIETIRLNDPRASQGSAPSVYASGRYWGQVIDLKLQSGTLFYDI
ncbi:MAG: hypothetical protein ABL984_15915 [Pyrinomonadaceae bacterium]